MSENQELDFNTKPEPKLKERFRPRISSVPKHTNLPRQSSRNLPPPMTERMFAKLDEESGEAAALQAILNPLKRKPTTTRISQNQKTTTPTPLHQLDQMYDNQIQLIVSSRKKPKTYTSGPNHWKKFRSRRGKPPFLDPSTPLENEQEIIRFITYCMLTAPNINKWTTVQM